MDIITYATALHRSASGANASFAPVMPICHSVGNHDDDKDAGDADDDDGDDDGEADADDDEAADAGIAHDHDEDDDVDDGALERLAFCRTAHSHTAASRRLESHPQGAQMQL